MSWRIFAHLRERSCVGLLLYVPTSDSCLRRKIDFEATESSRNTAAFPLTPPTRRCRRSRRHAAGLQTVNARCAGQDHVLHLDRGGAAVRLLGHPGGTAICFAAARSTPLIYRFATRVLMKIAPFHLCEAIGVEEPYGLRRGGLCARRHPTARQLLELHQLLAVRRQTNAG